MVDNKCKWYVLYQPFKVCKSMMSNSFKMVDEGLSVSLDWNLPVSYDVIFPFGNDKNDNVISIK